ncbi:ribose-5-phosphate isomerase [soil metagenome]
MRIALGADHRGFLLKTILLPEVARLGHVAVDLGAFELIPGDDYTVYADAVVLAVKRGEADLGVLICGSGEGMAMEANRTLGIRAAVVWRPEVATSSRKHNNANILVLPADYITREESLASLEAFIATSFSGEERHQRRIVAMDSPHPTQFTNA